MTVIATIPFQSINNQSGSQLPVPDDFVIKKVSSDSANDSEANQAMPATNQINTRLRRVATTSAGTPVSKVAIPHSNKNVVIPAQESNSARVRPSDSNTAINAVQTSKCQSVNCGFTGRIISPTQ